MFAVIISFIAMATPVQRPPEWVSELLKAAPALPTTSHRIETLCTPTPRPNTVSSSKIGVSDGRIPPYDPVREAAEKNYVASQRRVSALLLQGRYETAYQEALRDRGVFQVTCGGDFLVDAGLLAGHYQDVEWLLADYERKHYNEDEGGYLVPLSIAAAMQDKVYTGQDSFATENLQRVIGNGTSARTMSDIFRRRSTPKAVALAGILAQGFRAATPHATVYLEWALRLDPKNAAAAERLTTEYEWTRQYAEIGRVAKQMVHNLPAGEARDRFSAKLDSVAGKQNAPWSAKVDTQQPRP